MRSLDELIVPEPDDAWSQIEAWCAKSRRPIEILDPRRGDGEATLLAAQVTTRSPMGALALRSGGILIDGGWIRFLGAGNERIGGGLREWNESLGGARLDPPIGDAFVVAYDALGGWFALNGGRWPDRLGDVHYLTPDATGWQPLAFGYSGLLEWCMSERVDQFYSGQRWPSWRAEVAALGPDEAISIYPPLGFESSPVEGRSRRPVPARELWHLHHELARQVAGLPDGAQVEFDGAIDDSLK
jgi:hypothetical protein